MLNLDLVLSLYLLWQEQTPVKQYASLKQNDLFLTLLPHWLSKFLRGSITTPFWDKMKVITANPMVSSQKQCHLKLFPLPWSNGYLFHHWNLPCSPCVTICHACAEGGICGAEIWREWLAGKNHMDHDDLKEGTFKAAQLATGSCRH